MDEEREDKTKCGHCEATKGFELIPGTEIYNWERPLLIVRCRACRAMVSVVELSVPKEVDDLNQEELDLRRRHDDPMWKR